jgi:hypothetical protein
VRIEDRGERVERRGANRNGRRDWLGLVKRRREEERNWACRSSVDLEAAAIFATVWLAQLEEGIQDECLIEAKSMILDPRSVDRAALPSRKVWPIRSSLNESDRGQDETVLRLFKQ